MDERLLTLLACSRDRAALAESGDALECTACAARYAVRDGIVTFLDEAALSQAERREQSYRDDEASWYDSMFEGYTNAIEVTTSVNRIGRPGGPILDLGAGTGRITERLVTLGQPVVATDYSAACLRMLLERCGGASVPVLAVQTDIRTLPLRDGVVHATTAIQVYGHIRGEDERRRLLGELARVMVPGAPLAVTSYNYNLVFKAWNRLGNEGAREGEHMLGGDYYYIRQTRPEFRAELEQVFDVQEVSGIRNVPVRKFAGAFHRARLPKAGDRFLDWMTDRGFRFDIALERTPLSPATGFLLLARAVRRAGGRPAG